ncbi:hypothetical protein QBC44DRAFT_72457 [Cladorrhinum sp. PSN332]|nr:hypothetical protein QBC44DRAFT_72457 [Cladorrhinum sp. PSN332]
MYAFLDLTRGTPSPPAVQSCLSAPLPPHSVHQSSTFIHPPRPPSFGQPVVIDFHRGLTSHKQALFFLFPINMLSSVCLADMDKAPVFSRASVIPMTSRDLNESKENTAKSPKSPSRLSVFATIRRRTSRIFAHHNERPVITDHQTPQIWNHPRLKKRQSWFNSVRTSRHIHHFHREDYCSQDARMDLDDLTATITATTNSSSPRSPVKRLLRTGSSMFLSLRGRKHNHSNAVYDHDEEEHEHEDNRSILTIRNNSHAPSETPSVDLTLPVVCTNLDPNAGHRRSSFQLGVQKALQDKVDQNFSLDEEGSEPESGFSTKHINARPSLHVDTAIRLGGNLTQLSPTDSIYAHPPRSPHTVYSTDIWSPIQSSDSESVVRHSGSEEDSAGTVSSVSDVYSTRPPKTLAQVELTLAQLNLMREEELKALIKNKTGALTLAGRDRLILSFEATEGREWERVRSQNARGSSEYDDGCASVHHIKDDRTNLSLSVLEGDSGLFASTPKLQHSRSLRDELLQVGELSQICEGDSMTVGV